MTRRPGAAPRRRFERVWLFDLDNTLHDADPHIFPQMHRAMTAYIQAHVGIETPEAAASLRRFYWQRYGATLLGLMRHHGTDPRHFLAETHRFPELDRMVVRDAPLRAALARLPGRKVVFSNSPTHYARAVLKALRLERYFDDVFAIEHARFAPKPAARSYFRLLRRRGLTARQCIMVEDSPANLRTAKRLGMRTVLISSRCRAPAYVDFRLKSVAGLRRVVGRLT